MSWIKEAEQNGSNIREKRNEERAASEQSLNTQMDIAESAIQSVLDSLKESGYEVVKNARVPDSYLPFFESEIRQIGTPALEGAKQGYVFGRRFEIADDNFSIGTIFLIPIKARDEVECILACSFTLFDKKGKNIIESDENYSVLPINKEELIRILQEWITKKASV